MTELLNGYTGVFCQIFELYTVRYPYILNVHLEHLAEVLERLKMHKLICQLMKGHFMLLRMEYLYHV